MNFAWARVDRPGTYVPIGLIGDRLFQAVLLDVARRRRYEEPQTAEEHHQLRILRRSDQLRAGGRDQIGVARPVAMLVGGIATVVCLMSCSASSVPASFALRPVLNAQPGPCAHQSGGVPGIHGGCYQLATLGVVMTKARSVRAFPYTTRGSYIVVIVLGPDARPAL